MLSITFRFVRVIPAIPIRRTSDTEKTFLSYKVITSVTETKKNCIAVSNADRKKAFKRNKKEYDRLSDHIGFAP